jgi:cell division septation protein DedD
MSVSDITHDVVDDGFHEIHLSGKQLVFLFMATMVVSVVIFLIGVFVGRSVRAQQAAADQVTDPTAALAATAPTAAPSAPAAADAGPQAAEPPSPPAESDELSYKKRLEGDASAERLKPVPAAEPQASPARTAPPVPEPSGPARAASVASSPAPAAATAADAPVGKPQPGTWVIQVHALRDRTAAAGIVRRLASKGYPAFLVAAGPPTGVYKVQIGRYKDRDEAMRVIGRLKQEEQFNPWITR